MYSYRRLIILFSALVSISSQSSDELCRLRLHRIALAYHEGTLPQEEMEKWLVKALDLNRHGNPEPLFLTRVPHLNAKAEELGLPYLGLGIALDISAIEAKLSDAEKGILADPRKNSRLIVQMFVDKLYAADKRPVRNTSLRLASSYVGKSDLPGGGCRDKAVVLAGILNHYGIKAIIESGYAFYPPNFVPRDLPNHSWVLIPDLGLIGDPQNGFLLDEKEFLCSKVNVCYRDGVEIRPRQNPSSVVLRSRATIDVWKAGLPGPDANEFLNRYTDNENVVGVRVMQDPQTAEPTEIRIIIRAPSEQVHE